MDSEEKSANGLSLALSTGLQIESGVAPEIDSGENTSGNSNETLINIVSELSDVESDEYDTDSDNTDREEWLEENYLRESVTKNYSKQKNTFENEQKFFTYRKTNAKEQRERKFPSSYYKLDQQTILALENLIGVRPVGQYHEVIGKGKNSIVILIGQSNIHNGIFSYSFNNAIKIYKLTNDENFNKAIYKRVDREFENMASLRCGWLVPFVPYPIHRHKNILVMSIIGSKEEPPRPLSDITQDYCNDAYDEIIKGLQCFYKYWRIHGKLSTKNVLIWRRNLFYVGWSRGIGTLSSGTLALEKLMSDCCFVTKFFKSKGLSHVMPPEDLFKKITKLRNISPEVLDVLQKKGPIKKCRGNPNRSKVRTTGNRNCRFK